MALPSTMHRFAIEVSDVSRGVYESLELRVARHPSESPRHMVARVLGYCLQYEEGIAFGRGVSTAEEPAILIKDLRGDVTAWIEVGQPSPERLHKATKTGARVVVYSHRDPAMLLRELERRPIFRQEDLELFELPGSILEALESRVGRGEEWSVTFTEGTLYVSRDGETLEGTVTRRSLGPGE